MKATQLHFILAVMLLLALVTGLTACKKDKELTLDDLPPLTHEGKDTFGCVIDGEVFLPNQKFSLHVDPLSAMYEYSTYDTGYATSIIARGDKKKTIISYVNLILRKEFLKVRSYKLSNSVLWQKSYRAEVGINNFGPTYTTTTIDTGELNITYVDTTNKGFVAGTFWFNARDTVTNTIIKVREGRFDIPLNR